MLTFPDGRLVGPGELQDWLDALFMDPETTVREMQFALSVVHHIRAMSN